MSISQIHDRVVSKRTFEDEAGVALILSSGHLEFRMRQLFHVWNWMARQVSKSMSWLKGTELHLVKERSFKFGVRHPRSGNGTVMASH